MAVYEKIEESLFQEVCEYLRANSAFESTDMSMMYDPEIPFGAAFECEAPVVFDKEPQAAGGSIPEEALMESIPDECYIPEHPSPHAVSLSIPRIEPEESFSEMLLRLIDEKGMTDPDAYHKAWVDRRVFSKIRSNPDYTPLKKTAVSFALALELSRDAADELLMKAGYALSNSSEWDLIIRYCIEHGIYKIYDVNCILNEFELPLLG